MAKPFRTLYPERWVRITALILFTMGLGVILSHILAVVLNKFYSGQATEVLLQFFGVHLEGNFPTWFSSSQLMLIALTCGAIYLGEKVGGCTHPHRTAWLGFSALFLFLSFDETSQFHDHLDDLIEAVVQRPEASVPVAGGATDSGLNQEASGISVYPYLFFYVPVLGGLGLAMARFFFHRATRLASRTLFLVGMGCFALKLVVDSLEPWAYQTMWFDHHLIVETWIVEMGLFFFGETLILTALLNHLAQLIRDLSPSSFRV